MASVEPPWLQWEDKIKHRSFVEILKEIKSKYEVHTNMALLL